MFIFSFFRSFLIFFYLPPHSHFYEHFPHFSLLSKFLNILISDWSQVDGGGGEDDDNEGEGEETDEEEEENGEE